MLLDSTKIQSPILKRIAECDLSVVNDINEYNSNVTENIPGHGVLNPLMLAAQYGHIAVVKRLLEKSANGSYDFPEVVQNIAMEDNRALRKAARSGNTEIVKKLLAKNDDGSYEFPLVAQNVAVLDNYALFFSAKNGHIEVVKRLLAKSDRFSFEFPLVVQNIAVNNNYILRSAADNCHYEISYILARAQWPNGIKDIPLNLRCHTPSIRQGEILVNESDAEATQLFRWLQEGYIPDSRQNLYLPPVLSSRKPIKTIRMPFDVMNIIKKYTGTQKSIDTSRPTSEELNMISIKNINLIKSSSSIMNGLDRARVEREIREDFCNQQALILYSRLGFN
jgi:hypothetical protein